MQPLKLARTKGVLEDEQISFLQDLTQQPDMYGPFWIATTLIFALAVVSNFSRYVPQHWAALFCRATRALTTFGASAAGSSTAAVVGGRMTSSWW
jgi:hypothetical protein